MIRGPTSQSNRPQWRYKIDETNCIIGTGGIAPGKNIDPGGLAII